MYGSHTIPFRLEKEGVEILVEKEGESYLYRSKFLDETLEKLLVTCDGKVLINPIEPLNKPKKITSNLLIEFDKTVTIAPMARVKVYIKFPVEMGIFISDKDEVEIIDILTLAKNKFTLYGNPSDGMICKYWKSEVYSTIPSSDPMYEGIMELSIINSTNRWVEVSQSVFNANGMKIYYDHDLVSMKANMKIINSIIAETDLIDSPIRYGMEKSMELYTAKRIYANITKCIMEAGF
ncbi:Protein of unknown function DUF432 [Methanococcoides burtonii DSM 6242]|uniref:DUF432 domain-containing protein n=1 Tax=Methanococcoides burtonii (strain DSM 6242 / NBRC 107633 / OCM 468 / ACE-M) TaxID=259564 RepID=Q12YL6_METBU|nr:Protein of unknown function DUF432 [Methanococcoides burtonii DSM 6242]